VRADDPAAAERDPFPAGTAERILVALTGLEDGSLDADRRVPCDSLCWARGGHDRPDLAEAIARNCSAWFRDAAKRVDRRAIAVHAEHLGLGPYPVSGDAEWTVTARQWVDLWPRLGAARVVRASTATTLLAAAGRCVASPRGVARALHDSVHRVRAVVGESDEGAWVTGTLERRGPIHWSFALWVRGGTGNLATARAARLLDETIRVHEGATAERGGVPPAAIDAEP
jgi:hypothetical protein